MDNISRVLSRPKKKHFLPTGTFYRIRRKKLLNN